MLAAQRGGGYSNWKSTQGGGGRRSRVSSGSGSFVEEFENPFSSAFESDEDHATESGIQVTDEESDDKENCAKRIIEDPRFTMTVAFAIMLNVLSMTLQVNNPDVDVSWGCEANGDCWNLWDMLDRVFLIFFSVELALRLWGHGCRSFFCDSGEDQGWNIFDFFVVATCWIIWLFQSVDFTGSRFVKLLRSARMLRILRVLRIFRLRFMKKLNIIVAGLVHSFSVVSWIALMLGGVMFICAIICTEIIGNHAHDWGDEQDEIRLLFGSMSNSTITLFNFLTLADWSGVTRLVAKKEPSMTFFFLAYVIFAAMVILSLLTGVLADHMNTVREAEEREEEELRYKEKKAALKAELRAFQIAAQKPPRGGRRGNAPPNTIGMTQFKEIVQDPLVKEELEERGVKISEFDPEDLFECFDSTGSGAISWNDFRQGMEELRIGVKPRQIFKLEVSLRRAVKECRSELAASRGGAAGVGPRHGGGSPVPPIRGAAGGTSFEVGDVDLLSMSSSSLPALPKVEAAARLAQLSARSSIAAKPLGEFSARLRAFNVSESFSKLASGAGSDDEDSNDSAR